MRAKAKRQKNHTHTQTLNKIRTYCVAGGMVHKISVFIAWNQVELAKNNIRSSNVKYANIPNKIFPPRPRDTQWNTNTGNGNEFFGLWQREDNATTASVAAVIFWLLYYYYYSNVIVVPLFRVFSFRFYLFSIRVSVLKGDGNFLYFIESYVTDEN